MAVMLKQPISRVIIVLSVAASLWCTNTSRAQAVIKVGDSVRVRFGVLLQPQADWTQDPVTHNYQQNLFIRRMRLLVGGQVARDVSFFLNIDNPNLGKSVNAVKNVSPAWVTVDGYLEVNVSSELSIGAGLIVIPLCHNALQAGGNILPIDLGAYSFLSSGPLKSPFGRDAGFQARGALFDDRLEYRVGGFAGTRDSVPTNAFRGSGRLQYNFFEYDPSFFTAGTYLGKRKMFSIGGGVDAQQDYKAFAADAFLELPATSGSVTAQVDFIHYNGGNTLRTLPKQNTFLLEAGYLLSEIGVMPWVKIEGQYFANVSGSDQRRHQIGLTYFFRGQNLNIKAGYGRIDPEVGSEQNLFTAQLQAFYF